MLAWVLAVIIYLSVCVCVCLSVTHRYCIKTAKCRITQTTPRDSPRTLVFWHQKSLVDNSLPPGICAQSDSPPFRSPRFRPIFAHSASTVRAGEKSSISTNRKSTMRFLASHRWTVCVTPPKAQNVLLLFLPVKSTSVEKVCYKASLCESFQRQSCSYIIPLSNGP